MKKSIKILGLALITFSSIASASNLKVNRNLVHFQQSAVVNETNNDSIQVTTNNSRQFVGTRMRYFLLQASTINAENPKMKDNITTKRFFMKNATSLK